MARSGRRDPRSDPGVSVHDAVALRDRVWLSGGPEEDPPGRVPLHRYLRSLAESYLETETRMRFQPCRTSIRESGRARVYTCPAPPRQGMYFEDRRGRYGPESTRQPCWNGTGNLVEQASEPVKKSSAGDRQAVVNMRSLSHEQRAFAVS